MLLDNNFIEDNENVSTASKTFVLRYNIIFGLPRRSHMASDLRSPNFLYWSAIKPSLHCARIKNLWFGARKQWPLKMKAHQKLFKCCTIRKKIHLSSDQIGFKLFFRAAKKHIYSSNKYWRKFSSQVIYITFTRYITALHFLIAPVRDEDTSNVWKATNLRLHVEEHFHDRKCIHNHH